MALYQMLYIIIIIICPMLFQCWNVVTLALYYDIDDPERETNTPFFTGEFRSPDYDIDAPDCESIRTRNLLPAFWVTASLTVPHDV